MRADGEAPDPILTWHAIVYDQPSGWHHADLFRQHLGLDLVDIVPRGGPGADGRSDRELARVRPDTGRELVELIREYRSVMYPDTS